MVEYLWLPENRCNYGCPYCTYVLDGKRAYLVGLQKGVTTPQWISAWDRAYERDGEGLIYVTSAGEPTMHPDFARMIVSISRKHRVSFDTNLSWTEEELAAFLEQADPKRIKLELSFHPSDVSLGDFVSKARLIRDRGFSYQARWVAYPPKFDDLEAYAAAFEKAGLLFTVTPFCGTWEGKRYPRSYTATQRARILAAGESAKKFGHSPVEIIQHLVDQDHESPEGKLCRSGKDYAAVMPDGNAYRCQTYGMKEWERIGNFLAPGFSLPKYSARCRALDCGDEYRWIETAGAVAA